MQLLTAKTSNLSAQDITKIKEFLSNELGFVGVEHRTANGDWVITADGRNEQNNEEQQ